MALPELPHPGQDPWFSPRNNWDLAVEAELEGRLSEQVMTAQLDTRLRVFRPEEFGAVGDGVTDDSPAFNAMFDDMEVEGCVTGIVEMSPLATYRLVTPVYFDEPRNLQVRGNGATFLKTSTGILFATVSKENATGYGAGGENVILQDFTVDGQFAAGVVMSFHHVRNLKVDNVIWHGAIRNSHALDLMGCNLIEVVNCEFVGNSATEGASAYTEAVQADVSTYGASSVKTSEPVSAYDGLPTIDLLVHHCVFTWVASGGVNYAAPLPLGAHNFALETDEGYQRRISFENNRVTGWVWHATSGFSYGWIHLHGARDVRIVGNEFEFYAPGGVSATSQCVINNRPVLRVVTAATVGSETPSETVLTSPRIAQDWLIADNKFTGFASAPMANNSGIILFRAASNNSDALTDAERNVIIRNNTCDGHNADSTFAWFYAAATDDPTNNRFVFEGNDIQGGSSNSSRGVLVLNGVGMLVNNKITSTNTGGACVQTGDVTLTATGNRLQGGSKVLQLPRGTNCLIQGNTIVLGVSGIEVGTVTGAPAVSNILTGNLIIGTGVAARSIRTFESSTGAVVYGNRVINGASAVSNAGTGTVSTADNTVE